MKIIKWIAPVTIFAALAWLGQNQADDARAFATHGSSWASPTALYKVNANFTDASAGTAEEQIAAIQRAASEWKSAGQVPFEFIYDGTTTNTTVAPSDGENAVFYSNSDGGGALATATWSSFANGDFFGFDIEFYSMGGALDFVWATNPVGSQFDIESVATHEFGHALGLSHSASTDATMFASVVAGSIANRTLAADDIAGVQSLYGVQATGAPTVSNVAPFFGWIGGGERIRLTGTELSGGDPQVVTIDGVQATGVTVLDNSTIEFDVPMGVRSGFVPVSVSHAQGNVDLGDIFFNTSMRFTSDMQVGGTGQIELFYPADANLPYLAAPAINFDIGIPVSTFGDSGDTRVIPLNNDSLFQEQRQGLYSDTFLGFEGSLDGNGSAMLQVVLPNLPFLQGYVVCFASMTLDMSFTSGVKNISNAAAGQIQAATP
ncbi:MAG: matrixin family metalloprotease [Planctomycetota bacterium]